MFSKDQQQAFDEILASVEDGNSEHALSGPAGTGKTYLISDLVEELKDRGHPVHLTATTNKAARVASEMGGGDALTIHSLLGLKPEADESLGRVVLRKKRGAKIKKGAVVVIDEASMVEEGLLWRIRGAAADANAKVIFVGDACQLPPVFETESPVFRLVANQSHLTTIHRQALENPIIAAATGYREVLDGAPFPCVVDHKSGVRLLSREDFDQKILETFRDNQNCRVLTWTNNAARRYNNLVRDDLFNNPDKPVMAGETLFVNTAIERGENIVFGTDEQIKAIEVTPALVADVEGYIVQAVSEDNAARIFVPHDWSDAVAVTSDLAKTANGLEREKQSLLRDGDSVPRMLESDRKRAWRNFFEAQRLFADVRPPFASTVHKSQGSTYDCVFVDLDDIGKNTKAYEIARLVYVAMTRASETVYLTGSLPERLYLAEVA